MYNGKLIFQDKEVEEVKFIPTEQMANLIKKEKFDPVGKIVFEKYLETKNKIQ